MARAKKPVAPAQGRIVGPRHSVQLGLNATVPTTVKVAPYSGQWLVVSRGFALQMQGNSATNSKTGNGTLYGVFANLNAAKNHIKANAMGLYTAVIPATHNTAT